MGQAWDNEQAARRLLRYFIGKGELVELSGLVLEFTGTDGFFHEFETAISYAHAAGWIKYEGARIRLTPKGLEQPHEFP
jgi:hypothetical protein